MASRSRTKYKKTFQCRMYSPSRSYGEWNPYPGYTPTPPIPPKPLNRGWAGKCTIACKNKFKNRRKNIFGPNDECKNLCKHLTKILNDDADANSAIFIKTQPDATPSATQIHDWNRGIWANFWSTNPVSSNAIPFGGSTIGEIVNLSTFDLDNMNRGPDGTLKIFGPEIETRYPIQGWAASLDGAGRSRQGAGV